MYYVIGSGPASTAAAVALLAKGIDVTILDVGYELEPEKLEVKSRMAKLEPAEWDPADVQLMKSGTNPTTRGVPKKSVFGSAFPYREGDHAGTLELRKAKVMRSYAFGGLSNVWGSCILPYPAHEIADWPFPASDLDSHYRAVLGFVPCAGDPGVVKEKFGLASDAPVHSLKPSEQAIRILSDVERASSALARSHITVSRSSVAVDLGKERGGCRYCGMCLYGCPYDLIYSTPLTIAPLQRSGRLRYVGGVSVRRIEERGTEIVILANEIATGTEVTFTGSKAFLGAGVFETTRIMLESWDAFDHEVFVKNSGRFMLPYLRYAGCPGAMEEKTQTLCQLFMEMEDPSIDDRSVHLQLYTYNDLYKRALDRKLGPLASLLEWPVKSFLERLIIIFGYLHSDISGDLGVRLSKDSKRLTIEGRPNPKARRVAKRVAFKLFSHRAQLRGVPTLPFLDPPGGGNHSGGTFPMREAPARFECDRLGRPHGFTKLHIVDSSVFPSLPAATVTLPIMANAHRIASTCEE